ncbi:MAG: TIM barrel protein, partial [Candidatus Latescibacterota bacterium]
EYMLAVHNNDLGARPMRIESCCGPIRSLTELSLDQSEKGQVGYWPTGFASNDGGARDSETIAGGDIRVFSIRVAEHDVSCLPKIAPPVRPKNRFLTVRSGETIQQEILARPTFFQHFDGVKVDWTYVRSRDRAELERGAGWLARQQVRVVVDFSHGLNFYPDLTLLDTLMWRFTESLQAIDEVLDKMTLLAATDAVISLHRKPENYCDDARADARFLAGVQELCGMAQSRGITLHLQHHPNKWFGTVPELLAFVARVNAPNLRFALNTGHVAMQEGKMDEMLAAAGDRLGMMLLCAPERDLFRQVYDAHAPVAGSGLDLSALAGCDDIPQILDADYPNWDAEYRDRVAVWGNPSS